MNDDRKLYHLQLIPYLVQLVSDADLVDERIRDDWGKISINTLVVEGRILLTTRVSLGGRTHGT